MNSNDEIKAIGNLINATKFSEADTKIKDFAKKYRLVRSSDIINAKSFGYFKVPVQEYKPGMYIDVEKDYIHDEALADSVFNSMLIPRYEMLEVPINGIIKDIEHFKIYLNDLLNSYKSLQNVKYDNNLLDIAQQIFNISQELCPIKTGNLRSSAVLRIDNENSITIEYTASYASYVHEDMSKHHNIGQAKFLEVACAEVLGSSVEITEKKSDTVSITLGYADDLVHLEEIYRHYNI